MAIVVIHRILACKAGADNLIFELLAFVFPTIPLI
jgi:hypothetical protein